MDLLDIERSAVRVCFGQEPTDKDLEALGDRRTWLIYREMVRGRLLGEARIALKRTAAAAGPEVFDRTFERHLKQDPPTVRPFCAAPLVFAASAVRQWSEDPAVAPHLSDLIRYEATLWEVSDLPEREEAIVEFDFDRPVALSAALRLLSLDHGVQDRSDDGATPAPTFLCVHRAKMDKKPRTWTLTPFTHALMQCMVDDGELSASDAIRKVATDRGVALDAQFLEGLMTVFADFIERGIIVGSR